MELGVLSSRARVAEVNALVRGGVLLISVYFRTGVGLAGNADILDVIGRILLGCDRPWVLAGEWNFEPDILEASGWLRLVRGVVRAPMWGCVHVWRWPHA